MFKLTHEERDLAERVAWDQTHITGQETLISLFKLAFRAGWKAAGVTEYILVKDRK